ncbi:hypothetical protein G7Y79_00024g055330 [Physcia stellaris]|nr:hypothetical protein G7Y79_00024g055330 [Physcia stellaris]
MPIETLFIDRAGPSNRRVSHACQTAQAYIPSLPRPPLFSSSSHLILSATMSSNTFKHSSSHSSASASLEACLPQGSVKSRPAVASSVLSERSRARAPYPRPWAQISQGNSRSPSLTQTAAPTLIPKPPPPHSLVSSRTRASRSSTSAGDTPLSRIPVAKFSGQQRTQPNGQGSLSSTVSTRNSHKRSETGRIFSSWLFSIFNNFSSWLFSIFSSWLFSIFSSWLYSNNCLFWFFWFFWIWFWFFWIWFWFFWIWLWLSGSGSGSLFHCSNYTLYLVVSILGITLSYQGRPTYYWTLGHLRAHQQGRAAGLAWDSPSQRQPHPLPPTLFSVFDHHTPIFIGITVTTGTSPCQASRRVECGRSKHGSSRRRSDASTFHPPLPSTLLHLPSFTSFHPPPPSPPSSILYTLLHPFHPPPASSTFLSSRPPIARRDLPQDPSATLDKPSSAPTLPPPAKKSCLRKPGSVRPVKGLRWEPDARGRWNSVKVTVYTTERWITPEDQHEEPQHFSQVQEGEEEFF